jgi:phage N-6-adenine-methyltransferase
MNTDLMFSSAKCEWQTPQSTFDALHQEFGFETDVCALPENAKCAKFYTPEMDGLAQTWKGVCWMNPPYSREMPKWIRKAWESSQEAGATVVCLLPSRTDTKAWHDFCMKDEIRFIRGRLKFGGHTNSAPFPSAIVIFRPHTEAGTHVYKSLKLSRRDKRKCSSERIAALHL